MAKKKGKGVNRRKSSGGNTYKQLAALVAIIILIILAFFLLEESRRSGVEKPAEKGPTGQRQKMPSRPPAHPEKHAAYTAPKPVLPKPAKVKPTALGPGTVAIIIDDMGRSAKEARSLIAIDLPVTFSIIPGFAQSKVVAGIAHEKGREVMVHIPMEPEGYPEKKMEKNGLLVSDTEDQIESKVKGYLEDVPYAVGANNHMGSRFTEHEEKMRMVLQELKERDMFFVDSKTSPRSIGFTLARKMGVRAGARQVFLDNIQDVEAIKAQLQQVANTARKRGSAIAICHPHLTTIRALSGMMPLLKKEGITFVYASRLVS